MLKNILKAECIRLDLKSTTKDEIVDELAGIFLDAGLIKNKEAVKKAIMMREKSLTTALGKNVALPHAKTNEVAGIQMVIGIHPKGVDFDSPDHMPVNLFFAVLSPTHVSGPHIQCLAEIVRVVENQQTRHNLLHAKSPAEIMEIIKTASI